MQNDSAVVYPFVLRIQNVVYWKNMLNAIKGSFYVGLDFIYFESLIDPSEENSFLLFYDEIQSLMKNTSYLKPVLLITFKNNNSTIEQQQVTNTYHLYGFESITNIMYIMQQIKELSLSNQIKKKITRVLEEREEKVHVKSLKHKKLKKRNNQQNVVDLDFQIEKEKDEMLQLVKQTKELNKDSLQSIVKNNNELKESKEKYLEPIRNYNYLSNKLLTGMSWYGMGWIKNLWNYSDLKKLEKEYLQKKDEEGNIEFKKSLYFGENVFEILLKLNGERYFSEKVLILDKDGTSLDIVTNKQTRLIEYKIEYSLMVNLLVNDKTPFQFVLTLGEGKETIQIEIFSVFSPIIIDIILTKHLTIIFNDSNNFYFNYLKDKCKIDKLVDFYSNNSNQIVNIPLTLFETKKDKIEQKEDSKLDYLFDIVSDIREMSTLMGDTITESSSFIEDMVEEVDNVNYQMKKNIKSINDKI
ncbi:hypothetical protein ABK040_006459 [Willaertia magna]